MSELLEQNGPALAALLNATTTDLRLHLSGLHSVIEQLPEPQEKEAAVLYQSYYRILRLIGNMDILSRALEGCDPQLQDRDIPALCREVFLRCEGLFAQQGVQLEYRCDSPGHIAGVDPSLLQQVLFHLLSNALKAAPRGSSVLLRLQIGSGRLLFSVTDRGSGLPPGKGEELLQLQRQPQPIDLSPHGPGLGLPICRWIAESHGGSITLLSTPGKGCTATVSLPDRRCGTPRSEEPRVDYTGGFNPTLLGLADALDWKSFTLPNRD